MAQVTSNLYTRIPAELGEKLEAYLKRQAKVKTAIVNKRPVEEYLAKQPKKRRNWNDKNSERI